MKNRSSCSRILVLLLLTLSISGCGSMVLPPKISAPELAAIEASKLPLIVGVAEFQYPVYSERLIETLAATGLFDQVGKLDSLDDPDLIATIDRPVYGTAVLPVLTFLTLGVIPTVVAEEFGQAFHFSTPRQRPCADLDPIPIDTTYTGKTVLGWAAAPMNWSPRRTIKTPIQTQRYIDTLSASIAARAEDIVTLLACSKGS